MLLLRNVFRLLFHFFRLDRVIKKNIKEKSALVNHRRYTFKIRALHLYIIYIYIYYMVVDIAVAATS